MKFKMKDLGPCKLFLSVQIIRDWANKKIHLTQTAYIDKVLQTFGMQNAAGKSTLMELNALKTLVKNTGQASSKDIRLY